MKFGTRELHIITLSSCEFPANRAVKDTLYVGEWYELHHSFYIFHPISTKKNTAHVLSTKVCYVTALRENRRRDIYIYIYLFISIAYMRVWMNWCYCFTHWLPDSCEIRHENSAQSAADFVSFLHICEWKAVHLLWAHLMCVPHNRDILKPEHTSINRNTPQ